VCCEAVRAVNENNTVKMVSALAGGQAAGTRQVQPACWLSRQCQPSAFYCCVRIVACMFFTTLCLNAQSSASFDLQVS